MMQQNWYRTSCCHKLTALVIITSYFLLLIFVHDTTYIWATLGLVFVLFVTTFSCASSDSPFLLQLRGTRVTGITNRTVAQVENGANQEAIQADTRIWMTDIPPSYSFIMAAPPTPPPSYGSAILMFPPPYISIDSKGENESVDEATTMEGMQIRRPLSVSTQVSVTGLAPENVQLGGVSFSTQVSVISGLSDTSPTVRARFFLSRQVSREDEIEEIRNRQQEQFLSEAQARLIILSKHCLKEDSGEDAGHSSQEQGRGDRRAVTAISRQVSREEGTDAIDLQKLMKQDLRRRVLISRQASRDDALSHENQRQERSETDRPSSSEDAADNEEKKNSEARTVIVLTRQNSSVSTTSAKEDQKLEQSASKTAIQVQACGSAVYITIPEELKDTCRDKNT